MSALGRDGTSFSFWSEPAVDLAPQLQSIHLSTSRIVRASLACGPEKAAMSGLEFSEDAARQLEKLYRTRDIVAQRSETIRQLHLRSGERVLDVGCGPGFLCESIAEIVGRDGAVTGIDISSDLIALCNRRNPPTWLSYIVGDATDIGEPDACFDVVTCTQVAEYVPDVGRVVSETFRVLRPGGRALFVATDWDGVIWHSQKLERMRSVMK